MKKSTIVALIGYAIAGGLILHGVYALGSSFGKFDVSDKYEILKGDAESACKKFLSDESSKLKKDYTSDGVLDNAHYAAQDKWPGLDSEYKAAKSAYDTTEEARVAYLTLDADEALASDEHRDAYQALLDAITVAENELTAAEEARAKYLTDNNLNEEEALADPAHKDAYQALKDEVSAKEKAKSDAERAAKRYLENNSLTDSKALASDEHREAYQALKDAANAAKAVFNEKQKAVDEYLTITADKALNDPALKDAYQALVDTFNVANGQYKTKLKEARLSFWAYGIPSLLISLIGFGVATAVWTEAQKKDF